MRQIGQLHFFSDLQDQLAAQEEEAIRRHEEKRRREHVEFLALSPRTVALVACASRKQLPEGEWQAPAKELYDSQLFRAARKYAERVADDWYILSALYDLVRPDRLLPDYNRKLSEMPKTMRDHWSEIVASKIQAVVPRLSTLIFLAGREYRDGVIHRLTGRYIIEVPMEGFGIGQQVSWLNKQNSGSGS